MKSLFTCVALVPLLGSTGCGVGPGNNPGKELAKRCERALAKVSLEEMYNAPGVTGKPSGGEKAIMDGVRKASLATCQAEGLTREQAACFEKIKDIESLYETADCPAIVAKMPSWFRVPPPEMRREALEKMKAKKANTAE